MKLLKLTNGEHAIVDDNIHEALSYFNWRRDGTRSNAVICTSEIKGERRLHRIITGAKKGQVVDHIDGNVLNNLSSNLRICTQKENARNRKKNVNSRARYKGLAWLENMGAWAARIKVDGKLIHLGCFKKQKEAAKAYNKLAIRHYGLFARLNKI